jgi:hypothetical protein
VEPLNVGGKPVEPPPPRKPPEPLQRATDGAVTDKDGNYLPRVLTDIHDNMDVRNLVIQRARETGKDLNKPQRILAEHAEELSKLTGVPQSEILSRINRLLMNDEMLRGTMQGLHDTGQRWHDAALESIGKNDIDSLIKFYIADQQHELLQDFTWDQSSEAGRTLAVHQEFYGEPRPPKAEPKPPVKTADT